MEHDPTDEQRTDSPSKEKDLSLRGVAAIVAVIMFLTAGSQIVDDPDDLTRAMGWFSYGMAALSALIALPRW